MDVTVAQEQVFQLPAKFDLQSAKQRAEEKKVTLVAGMVTALLSRPRPEEIVLSYAEHRLEPFWHVSAHVHTVYDRQWDFNIPVKDPEIRTITTLGQELQITPLNGHDRGLALNGIEHCEKDQQITHTFDRAGTLTPDLLKLLGGAKQPIPNLATFAPEGVLVQPPDVPGIGIVCRLLKEVAQPDRALAVLDQQMKIDTIELYFRPIYAFEFVWAKKSKDVVIEYDALSGDMHPGKVERQARGPVSPEVLFDVSDNALRVAMSTLGFAIPGGAEAIHIAKQTRELVHN